MTIDFFRGYVAHALSVEGLYKTGETDTFEYNGWIYVLRREEDEYAPFTFGLNGRKKGTNESIARRFTSMENTFLFILNRHNENGAVRNKFTDIRQWIDEN